MKTAQSGPQHLTFSIILPDPTYWVVVIDLFSITITLMKTHQFFSRAQLTASFEFKLSRLTRVITGVCSKRKIFKVSYTDVI